MESTDNFKILNQCSKLHSKLNEEPQNSNLQIHMWHIVVVWCPIRGCSLTVPIASRTDSTNNPSWQKREPIKLPEKPFYSRHASGPAPYLCKIDTLSGKKMAVQIRLKGEP